MIYYFSGTGNSKWVAEQLAEKTEDMAVDLITTEDVPKVDNQVIGLVFPIYAWGAPEPVLSFVKRLVGKPSFAYGVCTCADEAGYAMEKLNRLFPFDSMFSVSMPSNYILAADVEPEATVRSKIDHARRRLEMIAGQVADKQPAYEVSKGRLPWLKSTLICPAFNRFARSTKPYYATDACISCGLCVQNCPAGTIHLVDGKPHWNKKCYQCLACINRCPTQAIQYGKGTLKRGRYQFQ